MKLLYSQLGFWHGYWNVLPPAGFGVGHNGVKFHRVVLNGIVVHRVNGVWHFPVDKFIVEIIPGFKPVVQTAVAIIISEPYKISHPTVFLLCGKVQAVYTSGGNTVNGRKFQSLFQK